MTAGSLPYVIGAALITAVVVWVIAERFRGQLRKELESARSAAAVAQARFDQAESQGQGIELRLAAALSDTRRLEVDNQRMGSELDEATRRRNEAVAAARLAEASRDESTVRRGQLESELQGLRERATGLERRAVAAEQSVTDLEAGRQSLVDQVSKLTGALSSAESQRDYLKERLEEQKRWVEDMMAQFKKEVIATAAQTMEERGRAFTETNRKEVETVVNPFRERLLEFQQRVERIYADENKDRGALREQIVQLTTLNKSVSEKTEKLTHALTVQSKSTGNWGETILAKILEDSGLRKDREYRLQAPIKGPDGESFIPDAVIDLPENRQLIVDSKVSNKSWSDYCAAGQDEEARASYLKLHLTSLRGHLKSLASKGYSQSPDLNTVDFVLMFVPVEGALLTALQEDETLYSDAYRSKVILVTPSTLMAVVKLAEGLWTLQRRKESADEIAEAGRKLYDKLANFAQTFLAVGDAIDDSRKAFDHAQRQLATGRGNAIRLAQSMLELGVTPSAGKQIPAELIETDGPAAVPADAAGSVSKEPRKSAEPSVPALAESADVQQD